MSLSIDVDKVLEVLLGDGWHLVENKSFAIDSYEFMWEAGMGDTPMHSGGPGFTFEELDDDGLFEVSGPITSVLAVRRLI